MGSEMCIRDSRLTDENGIHRVPSGEYQLQITADNDILTYESTCSKYPGSVLGLCTFTFEHSAFYEAADATSLLTFSTNSITVGTMMLTLKSIPRWVATVQDESNNMASSMWKADKLCDSLNRWVDGFVNDGLIRASAKNRLDHASCDTTSFFGIGLPSHGLGDASAYIHPQETFTFHIYANMIDNGAAGDFLWDYRFALVLNENIMQTASAVTCETEHGAYSANKQYTRQSEAIANSDPDTCNPMDSMSCKFHGWRVHTFSFMKDAPSVTDGIIASGIKRLATCTLYTQDQVIDQPESYVFLTGKDLTIRSSANPGGITSQIFCLLYTSDAADE